MHATCQNHDQPENEKSDIAFSVSIIILTSSMHYNKMARKQIIHARFTALKAATWNLIKIIADCLTLSHPNGIWQSVNMAEEDEGLD